MTESKEATMNHYYDGEMQNSNRVSVAKGLEGKVDSIGLRLSWNPPVGNSFVGYNLYRESPSGLVEKVTQEPKHDTTVWVTDTSGLWGWTWIVTGVLDGGKEKTLGSCLWYPSQNEMESLAEPPSLRLNASPQNHRRVFLDWDGDRDAAGYSLLVSRAEDGVYELYKNTGKTGTTLMLDILGDRNTYYFVVAPRDAAGRWLKRTKETKVELFDSVPAVE